MYMLDTKKHGTTPKKAFESEKDVTGFFTQSREKKFVSSDVLDALTDYGSVEQSKAER